jgi:hypothetical protein
MSSRIAGINVHKKTLAVVVSEVEVDSECRFERGKFGGNPTNCDRSLHGCSSKVPRQPSWNRRPNIGNQSGKRWKGIGRAPVGDPERCLWRRRSPIAGGGDRLRSAKPSHHRRAILSAENS